MTPRARAFGPSEAAHLLRRAAFAPKPGDIERTLADGPEATVARLLGAVEPAVQPEADAIDAELRTSNDREALAGAWLLRLGTTTEPLREQVVLFLHNHFVSALGKVGEGRMMLDQVALFRRLGTGSFLDLALAVARDPAMVRYLDSERSTRSLPNENFARELMELFTLGPGPYGERDVQEAARAFTGFHLRNGRFVHSAEAHDDRPKTVLGATGRWSGDDIVRLCVRHPATAPFLAAKLARAFVTDHPSAALVREIAETWRREDGDLGRVLAVLLTAEAFYAPEHRFAVTRSPAQLVAAVLRALPLRLPPVFLARRTAGMGQALLDPPTVKGYPGGPSWLNPATVLARRSFLIEAATRATPGADAPEDLAALTRQVLGRDLEPEVRSRIEAAARGSGVEAWRRRLSLLLCHPEFQRC